MSLTYLGTLWRLGDSTLRRDEPYFRLAFAMGKIRGLHACGATCSHIVPQPNSFVKSFAFRSKIEKEGLPRGSTPAMGAGGPEFKSRRPDQSISRVFFSLLKAPFTSTPSVEFWQTGGLDSQVVYFQRVRHMTNLQKHEEQECYTESIERREVKRALFGKYGENSGGFALCAGRS